MTEASDRYTLIVRALKKIVIYSLENKCIKCNLQIHPLFIGYHKCGYGNCPICKNAVTNSEYWNHIRSHPGHENDSPAPRSNTTFYNRDNRGMHQHPR
jgi:hypothetical protein